MFGVNRAPFLELRTLQHLSDDVDAQYPRASDIICNYIAIQMMCLLEHIQSLKAISYPGVTSTHELSWVLPSQMDIQWKKIFLSFCLKSTYIL